MELPNLTFCPTKQFIGFSLILCINRCVLCIHFKMDCSLETALQTLVTLFGCLYGAHRALSLLYFPCRGHNLRFSPMSFHLRSCLEWNRHHPEAFIFQ